jgi:uncharacterized protein YoxC
MELHIMNTKSTFFSLIVVTMLIIPRAVCALDFDTLMQFTDIATYEFITIPTYWENQTQVPSDVKTKIKASLVVAVIAVYHYQGYGAIKRKLDHIKRQNEETHVKVDTNRRLIEQLSNDVRGIKEEELTKIIRKQADHSYDLNKLQVNVDRVGHTLEGLGTKVTGYHDQTSATLGHLGAKTDLLHTAVGHSDDRASIYKKDWIKILANST